MWIFLLFSLHTFLYFPVFNKDSFFFMKVTIHHLINGRSTMKQQRLALHPSVFPVENHGRVLIFSHQWLPVDYASFLTNYQLWINSVGLPVEKWGLCSLTLPSCLNVWYLHLVFYVFYFSICCLRIGILKIFLNTFLFSSTSNSNS